MENTPAPTAANGNTGADETPVPGRIVRSWALWDWATQPFNSVILTFVWVSLYLVSDSFLPDNIAAQNADVVIPGLVIAARTTGPLDAAA